MYTVAESNFTIYNEKPVTDIEILNCEALVCPETVNFSTIINDTRYDYFSLYVNPPRKHLVFELLLFL